MGIFHILTLQQLRKTPPHFLCCHFCENAFFFLFCLVGKRAFYLKRQKNRRTSSISFLLAHYKIVLFTNKNNLSVEVLFSIKWEAQRKKKTFSFVQVACLKNKSKCWTSVVLMIDLFWKKGKDKAKASILFCFFFCWLCFDQDIENGSYKNLLTFFFRICYDFNFWFESFRVNCGLCLWIFTAFLDGIFWYTNDDFVSGSLRTIRVLFHGIETTVLYVLFQRWNFTRKV